MLVGLAGDTRRRAAAREDGRDARPGPRRRSPSRRLGPAWARTGFRTPYLRNALWDGGLRGRHARDRDRLDAPARRSPPRSAARSAHGLEDIDERVHAFSHLSHVLPDGLEPVRHLRVPPRGRPGRDARALAPAQARRQRGHREPRRRRSATSTASARTTPPTSRPRRARWAWRRWTPSSATFDPDGLMNAGRPARGPAA